jgi:hypothetical protein
MFYNGQINFSQNLQNKNLAQKHSKNQTNLMFSSGFHYICTHFNTFMKRN